MTTHFTAQEIDLNSKNNHEMISAFRKVDSEEAEYKNLCISDLESVFKSVGPVGDDVTNLQSKLITLIGDPGIGKTTEAQKLAWMWACDSGLLSKMYKLIFFIPIRHVKHISLFDALSHLDLLPGQVNDQICTYNAKDILFIIDGADENDISPDSEIHHVITGNKFSDSTVLMTARPEAKCFKSISVLPRVKVTLLGTDEETIDRYVKDAIQETEWQYEDNYKTKLSDTSLLHIPLYLTLFCAVFKHYIAKGLKFKVPESATDLFNVFLQVILRRWWKRKYPDDKQEIRCGTFPLGPDASLPAEIKKCLYFIGKLCFMDLTQAISNYEFTDSQASECLLDMQDIGQCGLFTVKESRESFVLKYKQLQEYLAALYLSYEGTKEPLFHDLLYSEQNKGRCLATIMRDSKLIKVVEFACGLSAKFLKSLLVEASSQLCVMKGSEGEINIYYEAALFKEQHPGDLSGVSAQNLEGFSELKHYLCNSEHEIVGTEEFHFLLPDWKYTDKLSFYQKCLHKLTILFDTHLVFELLSRLYNVILTPVTSGQSTVYQIETPKAPKTRCRFGMHIQLPLAFVPVSVRSVIESSNTGQSTKYKTRVDVTCEHVPSEPGTSIIESASDAGISLTDISLSVTQNAVSSELMTLVTKAPNAPVELATLATKSPDPMSPGSVTSVTESPKAVSSEPVTSDTESPKVVSSVSPISVTGSPITVSSEPDISVSELPDALTSEFVKFVPESPNAVLSEDGISATMSPDAVSPEIVTTVADTHDTVSSEPVTSITKSPDTVPSEIMETGSEFPDALTSESLTSVTEFLTAVSSESVTSVTESCNAVSPGLGSSESATSDIVSCNLETTDQADPDPVLFDNKAFNTVTFNPMSSLRSPIKLCLDQLQTELLSPFCIPDVHIVYVQAGTSHVDLPALLRTFPHLKALIIASNPYIPYTSHAKSDRQISTSLTAFVLLSCSHSCQLPQTHVECLLKQSGLTKLMLHNVNILSALSDSRVNELTWSKLQNLTLQDILGELPLPVMPAVCTVLQSSCKTLNHCELILRNADAVCDITDALKTLTSLKVLKLQIKLSDGIDVTGEVLCSALQYLKSLQSLCVRLDNVEDSLITLLEEISTQDHVTECHIHDFDWFDVISPELKEKLKSKAMIYTNQCTQTFSQVIAIP